MFMPRALIVSAGFLLAGLLGLGAYFLPVYQVASSSVRSGYVPDLDPRQRTTAPFTVLLLGSDDVDNYVWIGLNGLVKLVDQLGGLNVIVTNPVMDDFYPSDLTPGGYPYDYYRVAVLPGATHLDGRHALQYVRSRHGDLRGDFARSERQQQVLLAIKSQASRLNVADLPTLVSAFNGEIKTSMGLSRIRQLISVAGEFDPRSIRRVVLVPPYTSEAVIAGQDVVMPHWETIRPLVHESFP